jgi:hypothetical protein
MTRPRPQLFLDRSPNNFSLVEALGQITLGTIIDCHKNRRVIDPDSLVAVNFLSDSL